MTLDEAWREAEAALPEGAWITVSGNARVGYKVAVYNMLPFSSFMSSAVEIAKATAGPLSTALRDITQKLVEAA